MKSPRTLLLADLFLQGLLSLFKSMAVASVGIIALMFFFNYGKPYDWFHSPVIAACSVIAPLLLGAFLWTMILRGFGMMVLFIAFGLYVVEDLEPKLMLSNTFFLINSRSVLAPMSLHQTRLQPKDMPGRCRMPFPRGMVLNRRSRWWCLHSTARFRCRGCCFLSRTFSV